MGGEKSLKKVLLYSGGMDSWLIDKLWKPSIKIYVNLGTEYSEEEIKRLPNDVQIIDFFFLNQFSLKNSIIPLRNLYLYAIAANATYFDDVEICLGSLNGDRINDKSKKFAELLDELMKYLYEEQQSQPGRKIKISMPYKNKSKRELCEMYVKNGGNLETAFYDSFTCYHPVNGNECGNCKACFRKAIPFIVAGMKFTPEQKEKYIEFYESNVALNMDDYVKNKGKEGIDCLKAIEIIKGWKNEYSS